MKKFCLLLTWLAWGCLAGAQSLLTGTVKLPNGTGFTGRLIFALAQNASASSVSPCTGPTLVVPTEQVTVGVNSGSLVSPPTLVSSVCTIPIGVPYLVTAIDTNGNIVFTDQWLIDGTTFDVGRAVSSETSPVVNYKGLWSSTTTYLPGDVVAYGGSTPNLYFSLLGSNLNNVPAGAPTYWQEISGSGGGGGGGTPYAPAYSVQIANADATAFLSDPNITINPSTHVMEFGGPVTGPSFTLINLAAITSSWTFDVTSPVTATNSLAPGLASPPAIGGTAPNAGSFSSLTDSGITGATQCVQANSVGLLSGTGVPCGSGSGVTSVAMTMDGVIFNATVAGSPITTSGTLAPSLKSQNSGLFLAGPASGVAAVPTFRGIVNTDLIAALQSPPAIGGTSPAAGAFSSLTDTGAAASSGTACLQIDTAGAIGNSGFACGSSGVTQILAGTNVTLSPAGGTGAVTINASGGMVYPGAGVANSTGTAWGTSYTVGTAANNLVQLNGTAQLPAVSGALLTNLPFMSLTTNGTSGAATLTGGVLNIPQYAGGGAFSGGLGTSYQDVTETAAPANPAAGNDRLYLNSATHQLACLTSSGASCTPGAGPTYQATGANIYAVNGGSLQYNAAGSYETDFITQQPCCGKASAWNFYSEQTTYSALGTPVFTINGDSTWAFGGQSIMSLNNTATGQTSHKIYWYASHFDGGTVLGIDSTDVRRFILVGSNPEIDDSSQAFRCWLNGTDVKNASAPDICMFRSSAGIVGFNTTDSSTGFLGKLKAAHFLSSGASTITAGAGAGTTPTIAISGNDEGGQVTLTTGTTPTASAVVATITLANACPAATYPTLSAAGANSAALTGTSNVWAVGATASTWTINAGSAALAASTAYTWNFTLSCN